MKKYLIQKVFYLMVLMLGAGQVSHAQKFDQAYLKWKAEQQAHDARLKQQEHDNHYLSKPSSGRSAGAAGHIVQVTAQKISLNSADVMQLQQLSGVGAKKAQAIIEHRNQHGKFKSIDELKHVKGIGPGLFEKNKAQLSL
ncbi:ComEA family DNA-binding protein [Acinetobacter sp. WZC-1]|uniref:ComEA family DNA-binding protein n=1 Tax=Acinetobacter sp. WZC-1 TaxID=3459034 RepID=UPI00403E1532